MHEVVHLPMSSKRSLLLIGSLCLAAGCSLYDELQLTTYASLSAESPDAGHNSVTTGKSEPNEAGDRSDAGVSSGGAADGGAGGRAAQPSPAASEGEVDQAGASAAGAASSAGRSASGTAGGVAAGSGGTSAERDVSAAGSSGAGVGGGAGTGAAGTAGSAGQTPDPDCAEDGGQTWAGNGHCYFPVLVHASWNVSRDHCSQADARLATITSAEELSFVAGLLGSEPSWIGLSRFGAPQFSWSTGETYGFSNWAAGEPNLSGEAAVAIRKNAGEWFDDTIDASHPAICERP